MPELPFPDGFPEHKRRQVLLILEALMAHCNLTGSGDGDAVLQAAERLGGAPMRTGDGSILPWCVAIPFTPEPEFLPGIPGRTDDQAHAAGAGAP